MNVYENNGHDSTELDNIAVGGVTTSLEAAAPATRKTVYGNDGNNESVNAHYREYAWKSPIPKAGYQGAGVTTSRRRRRRPTQRGVHGDDGRTLDPAADGASDGLHLGTQSDLLDDNLSGMNETAGETFATKEQATTALQVEVAPAPTEELPRPQLAPVPPGQIRLASFNIRIYSTGSRDDTELGLIADRLQQFDLVAIQELQDEEVVQRTLSILEARAQLSHVIVSPPGPTRPK